MTFGINNSGSSVANFVCFRGSDPLFFVAQKAKKEGFEKCSCNQISGDKLLLKNLMKYKFYNL